MTEPQVAEELAFTLDDAVAEVLGLLTGLDLRYEPEQDRYAAITRQLNRALRSNALEKEWSYYADTATLGTATAGDEAVWIPANLRPRIVYDDTVRLVDTEGRTRVWAKFLPRDAIYKYSDRADLWVAHHRDQLIFSRPIPTAWDGYDVVAPLMREPVMFRLPEQPEDPEDDLIPVPDEIREQLIDFPYPDVIILRAAFYYAQTDPVMQPRVQTLEAQYKDLYYQVASRDDAATDSPYMNEFTVPIQGSLAGGHYPHGRHPHSDERR